MSLSDKRASFGEKIVDSGDKQLPQTCFAGKSSILNRFKKQTLDKKKDEYVTACAVFGPVEV